MLLQYDDLQQGRLNTEARFAERWVEALSRAKEPSTGNAACQREHFPSSYRKRAISLRGTRGVWERNAQLGCILRRVNQSFFRLNFRQCHPTRSHVGARKHATSKAAFCPFLQCSRKGEPTPSPSAQSLCEAGMLWCRGDVKVLLMMECTCHRTASEAKCTCIPSWQLLKVSPEWTLASASACTWFSSRFA